MALGHAHQKPSHHGPLHSSLCTWAILEEDKGGEFRLCMPSRSQWFP